jgi:hypothetical protein
MASHGKKAGFHIRQATSTLATNISSYLTSIDFPRTVDTAEVTTFNTSNGSKTYVTGLNDATVSVEGVWSTTPDGIFNALIGASSPTQFWYQTPSTSAAAAPFVQYTANAIVTGYSPPSAVGDAVTFSADLQVTGTVTRTTTT